jgi:hypothetical protein
VFNTLLQIGFVPVIDLKGNEDPNYYKKGLADGICGAIQEPARPAGGPACRRGRLIVLGQSPVSFTEEVDHRIGY